MRRWDLDDLASISDLARDLGVGRAAVCNWRQRYEDFPAPLITLSSGPVFSHRQVRAWHESAHRRH